MIKIEEGHGAGWAAVGACDWAGGQTREVRGLSFRGIFFLVALGSSTSTWHASADAEGEEKGCVVLRIE